jgi:protein involved in polysaccharide export with SLBB domain
LKPEPLSEFQRFVLASTGQTLPVYGASLFSSQPASFGPVDHGPAHEHLIVGADDELRIRIWGQVNFSANLRVSREGEIFLPKVGAVHVAGLPFSEVAGHLRNAIGRVYRNFELSVDMGEIHSIQVYVTGMARRPGEYTVSALSTLVDAVFTSGGPAANGSMRHVQLKREGKVVTDFDLYALLIKGDKTGDVELQPGDVLYIPAAGPQVALEGSVREAGIFELRGEESLGRLLDAAGGRTAIASGARISVERIENRAHRRAFELAGDSEGLATLLDDGDIVRIDPIVSDYLDTVTLRGSVANPGRFRWHAGMRLSDLLPDRDALVTRNYWWRRTQLGLPAPEFADLASEMRNHEMLNHADNTVNTGHPNKASSAASTNYADHTGIVNHASSARDATYGDDSDKTESTTGTQDQTAEAAALESPGSQTNWNYAAIERLDKSTMTTSLLSFDLGKLVLGHDMSQDLDLQPGDVITIFSQEDIRLPISEQTKYVRLEGEFAHAGVYSVAPGETLRALIVRAGGLTGRAYLYGSEFIRKSTRELEQQRYNEYLDKLEHEMERSSISSANQASASGEGGASQDRIAAVDHELVARLRKLRPTGRIVLDLHPHSAGEDALPDMALEDGDQLSVPSTPGTVEVMGAVLNQNAFLYRENARVGDYLHLAGGPSRDADRGHVYILRADGSVTSRDAGQPVFASGFDRLRLYPGDSIIVPEKGVGPGAMREFLSWTQMFSQFALGAAAISVIK